MLRDYQQTAVDAALNHIKYRAPLHGYVTAPGGSGKSHMIAAVAEGVVGVVVVLARSEKLVSQNVSKFHDPSSVGVYCAGLGRKETDRRVTVGTIQSMATLTLQPSVILVDECDEISQDEESQYQTFFAACGNPMVVGFTATPFRTNSGRIEWGEEICNIPLPPLFKAKYLTPPTNKVGVTLDLSGVSVKLGDYVTSQLEEVYKDPELLALSVAKVKQYSQVRNAVLIFAQSLRHADLLAMAMEENGMPATIVHGETDKDELNDIILPDFHEGRIKYLINVALLVRGYDMPAVDMIAVLLATKSKRKWEQILYRGTRLHHAKSDFLVLDMGNNFATHGPLGSPWKGTTAKESTPGGRICPSCETYVSPITARVCADCGYEWPEVEAARVTHSGRADSTSRTIYEGAGDDDIVTYEVTDVTYKSKTSKSKNPMIVVSYYCGYGKYGTIADFLLPHHSSPFVTGRVVAFFKERGNELGSPLGTYTMDDLLFHCETLRKPHLITVDHREEFPRIIRYEWEPRPTEEPVWEDMLGEEPL